MSAWIKKIELIGGIEVDKIKRALCFIGKFIKNHKGWLILAILLFGIVTAYRYITRSEERENALSAAKKQETSTIETRNLVDTISATGTVESAKVRTLASTIIKDTKITSVNCEVGDQVEEGDILVTFSYDSINKSIAQLQEDIAESKATEAVNDTASTRTYYYSYGTESMTIRDLQTAIEEKQKALNEACAEYGEEKRKLDELKGLRDSAPEGGETETTIKNEAGEMVYTKKYYDQQIENQEKSVANAFKNQETAQTSYDKAVQDLEDEVYKGSNSLAQATETYQKNTITSTDSTKKLQRQLEDYKDQLDNYVIVAPISGTVTSVDVEENNSFSGGNMVTIQDCSTLYVSAEIDEYDISKIKEGQKVVIKTEATEDDELEGVIEQKSKTPSGSTSGGASGSASGSTSNVTYAVKIRVITEDDRLMLGMTAKISIILDEVDNVLTVPYDAIVEKEDGQTVIYVQDEAWSRPNMSDFDFSKKGTSPGKIGDMTKDDENTIPDMNKGDGSDSGSSGRPMPSGDGSGFDPSKMEGGSFPERGERGSRKTSLWSKIKEIFEVAYGEDTDTSTDISPEIASRKEIPVEVGMESDYYTQISGADIKEGMTVIIQDTDEEGNVSGGGMGGFGGFGGGMGGGMSGRPSGGPGGGGPM